MGGVGGGSPMEEDSWEGDDSVKGRREEEIKKGKKRHKILRNGQEKV